MPKFLKYLFTSIILSFFLVACGTSNETDEPVTEKEQTQQEETEQQPEETQEEIDEETEPNTDPENPSSENENEGVEQESSTPSEIQLKYSFNGESLEEKAFWKKSDNQEFGLYVLPSYELTAEEPRFDQVSFSENDSNFMRISILPGDTNLDELKENTLAQLQAVNEDVQTLSPPEGEFFNDATVMQTKLNNELVTAYLIQQKNSLIKLMIYTNEQENHLDAFLQMAKHIKVNE